MFTADGRPRDVLFISYASEDRDVCSRVAAMLSVSAKPLGYTVWYDQSQRPGRSWTAQLGEHLGRAGAVVLLVSLDALSSVFIWEQEVLPLLSAGVPVAPLLVRDCPWETRESLRDLQFLTPPGVDASLLSHPVNDQERILAEISRGLELWLPPLEELEAEPEFSDAQSRRPISDLPLAAPGSLHGVPSLPAEYQPRPQLLDAFREQLLRSASGAAGITSTPRLGLHGDGGVGKSVLASALAHDEAIRSAFPDGIYWITVGERPDIPTLQARLADQLGVDISSARLNPDRRRELIRAVNDKRCLIIVDDVWTSEGAVMFNISGPSTRVLFTTRKEKILALPELRATPLVVSPLSMDEAIEFVANQVQIDTPLPSAAVDVIELSGRVIFALSIAVGAHMNGLSWEALKDLFTAATAFYPKSLEGNLRAMRVAMSTLTEDEIERYSDLVVFSADEPIPVKTVARMWRFDEVDAHQLLARLQRGRLLEVDGSDVRLHDDQVLYLSGRTPDQTTRHIELLNSHKPESGLWRDLPTDDGYLWAHLVQHLVQALDEDQEQIVTDVDWIAQSWALNGFTVVERDLEILAGQNDADHPSHAMFRRTRRVAHLLRGLDDATSIANTLELHLGDLATPSTLARTNVRDWLTSASGLGDPSDLLERVLTLHDNGVLALATMMFDQRWRIASSGKDHRLALVDAFSPEQEPTYFEHDEGWLSAVCAFRWRGDWHIAAAGDSRNVVVWNASTRELAAVLPGQMARVVSLVAFTHEDETYVCVGAAERRIGVYRLSDQTRVSTFRGHAGSDNHVAVLERDGYPMLASSGKDASLQFWYPLSAARPDAEAIVSLPSPGTAISSVMGASVPAVVVGMNDGSALIATYGGEPTTLLARAHTREVKAIVGFHEGRELRILASSTDGSIEARSARDGFSSPQVLRGHLDSVNDLALIGAPSVSHVVSASDDSTLRLWDMRGGVMPPTSGRGHSGRVSGIAGFGGKSGDGVATVGEDGAVYLWTVGSADSPWREYRGEEGAITAVAAWQEADLPRLAWGHQSGVISISGPGLDELVPRFELRQPAPVTGLKAFVGPDGSRLLAASGGRAIRLWDLGRPEQAPVVMREHENHVTGFDLHDVAGNVGIVSVSSDRSLIVWDISKRRPDTTTRVLPRAALALATYRENSYWSAVVGDEDGRLRVIELASRSPIRELGTPGGRISAVAIVGAGADRRVVVGAADGLLTAWDLRTGERTARSRIGQTISALVPVASKASVAVAYDSAWAEIELA